MPNSNVIRFPARHRAPSFAADPVAHLRQVRPWSVLSAERADKTPEVNAARTAALHDILLDYSRGAGVYPTVGYWNGAQERSFLVLGMPGADATVIGRVFAQDAVLTSDGMVTCATGACSAPLEISAVGRGKAPACYSETSLPDGSFIRWVAK